MSYDIRFGVKVAGAPEGVYAGIGEPEYSSPTYNVSAIFRKSMGWDYEQGEWYPILEVMPKIERGIHELRFNAKEYKQYEPDNGWGSVGTALRAMQSILQWFDHDYINGWNGEIPMDCIYMRW